MPQHPCVILLRDGIAMNNKNASENTKVPRQINYNTVWRWHFYAGVFCIPFAIWLSITGAIYLFKPQIENWLDAPYDNLTVVASAKPSQQVQAALAAAPNTVLNAYEMPRSNHSAIRILVGKDKELTRVYVHPQTLEILKITEEDDRLMRFIFKLHGELLMGDKGSMLVELAASWMIILIITGLYLWYPRNANGIAGILYPRLTYGGRIFWRDIHSVTGIWVSIFLLFLLISGLPWAKSWGGMLKQVRQMAQTSQSQPIKQDWTTGTTSEILQRKESNTPMQQSNTNNHSEHGAHTSSYTIVDYTPLNEMVDNVTLENLAPPAYISPPSKAGTSWSARSDSQNRPLRATLKLDETTRQVIERKDFAQRPLLDRIIGFGVAAHEGQLFGWFNQLLGLLTAIATLLLGISSIVLWWSRRPAGTLGAPKAKSYPLPIYIGILIVLLGCLLPLLGISLLIILFIEVTLLCRVELIRNFLGLAKRGTL